MKAHRVRLRLRDLESVAKLIVVTGEKRGQRERKCC